MTAFAGAFGALLVIGTPLFVALLVTAVLLLALASHMPLDVMPQVLFSGIDSTIYIAVPLFLLTGFLMTEAGGSARLIRFLEAMIGHWPGGLALVTLLASVFFAGITGSSAADTAAIGTVMIPAMLRAGYDRRFAAGVVAAGGTLGVIVPPSIPLILYGAITQTSITRLFAASVVPGIVVGGSMLAVIFALSLRGHFAGGSKATGAERMRSFVQALPVMALPIIIRGGIDGGIFTPTESAAVAALYAYLIGAFVYRSLTPAKIARALVATARVTSMILLVVTASVLLGFFFVQNQTAQHLTDYLLAAHPSPIVFLALVNVALLVLGFFLEAPAIIYLTVPLLLPAFATFNINPVHFAIVMMLNMAIGLIHPPVGLNLYIISGITRRPVEEVAIGVLPFVGALLFALVIVTYVPALSAMGGMPR